MISLLNPHASNSGSSNEVIHIANSALSGISDDLLQNSMCLSMQHSIFAINPSNKTAYSQDTWVLDIGATDHIVHSVALFTKITSSVTSFVQLPNGERVVVTHIGTIQVTSSLVLENVLCVPSFTFNLISISQLIKSLSCYSFFGPIYVLYRTFLVGKQLEWVSCIIISICCKLQNLSNLFQLYLLS